MEIAIIGAGNVGRALAISGVRAGHSVVISAIDPAHARDAAGNAAGKAGAKAASSNAEAVGGAETVILAVPVDAVSVIVDELGAALDGKVVVDVTNRVDLDDPGAVLDGTSTAETLQSRVPSALAVGGGRGVRSDPVVDGVRVDGYVAGDDAGADAGGDAEAKAVVLQLVESIGFVPIDVGPLSRVLEGMGLLNITLNIRNGWPWQDG